MSEYATESPVSLRRRRQRRRTLITIGVILLGLFFAFWYALSYYQQDSGRPAAAATPTACRTVVGPVPGDVKVRVLNATNRNGLAGRTVTSFQRFGFGIYGEPANASTKKVPKVAQVQYGKDGKAAAKLVLQYMPKGTSELADKRGGRTVTVVLGTGFDGLTAPDEGPEASLPACPSPSGS